VIKIDQFPTDQRLNILRDVFRALGMYQEPVVGQSAAPTLQAEPGETQEQLISRSANYQSMINKGYGSDDANTYTKIYNQIKYSGATYPSVVTDFINALVNQGVLR